MVFEKASDFAETVMAGVDPQDVEGEVPTLPEQMMFNANLQEFTNRVGIICGLESNGKITQEDAYHQIKELWKMIKKSKKNLRIGEHEPTDEK
ncbi:MAG: hypothetical protein MI757_11295 [Pirellulales bacterium]|nr:hypothetical protein [Pirellulales bacterium]